MGGLSEQHGFYALVNELRENHSQRPASDGTQRRRVSHEGQPDTPVVQLRSDDRLAQLAQIGANIDPGVVIRDLQGVVYPRQVLQAVEHGPDCRPDLLGRGTWHR